MRDFEGAERDFTGGLAVIPANKTIGVLVGAATTVLTRPKGMSRLHLHGEKIANSAQPARLRPGDYASRSITTTIATSAALSCQAHALETGDGPFKFASESINGVDTSTLYWIIKIDANRFKLAASYADAVAGAPVTINADGGNGLMGGLSTTAPGASVADGYGSIALLAGERLTIVAPDRITIGTSANDIVTYWWS